MQIYMQKNETTQLFTHFNASSIKKGKRIHVI